MSKALVWTKGGTSGQYSGMIAGLLSIVALIPSTGASASGVTGVDMQGDQIVVRFDGTVENASLMVLDGPRRIAIDVGGAEYSQAVSMSNELVENIRQAQFSPGTARIVFDLARPALVSSGEFAADGRSLTLSLNPVAADVFGDAAKSARKLYLPPAAHRSAPPRSRYNVTIPLDPPGKGFAQPKIYGPAGRPLVVIDAGHGGHDPGAISPHNGAREKDITLAVARKIRDELVASGRVRVALTREDDTFIVLRDRTAIARGLGAALFISIHADSASTSAAEGATVYTLSEVASDREAAQLANRENKSDIINGVNLGGENAEVASILVDLAQRETMNMSAGFANMLKREGSKFIPFRNGFHRMAGFAVLKAPDIPSVLLEIGYVTNANDAGRINSVAGRDAIAAGLRKAVEIHFARQLAIR